MSHTHMGGVSREQCGCREKTRSDETLWHRREERGQRGPHLQVPTVHQDASTGGGGGGGGDTGVTLPKELARPSFSEQSAVGLAWKGISSYTLKSCIRVISPRHQMALGKLRPQKPQGQGAKFTAKHVLV